MAPHPAGEGRDDLPRELYQRVHVERSKIYEVSAFNRILFTQLSESYGSIQPCAVVLCEDRKNTRISRFLILTKSRFSLNGLLLLLFINITPLKQFHWYFYTCSMFDLIFLSN